jgi:allophanate hydrolase subunit 1
LASIRGSAAAPRDLARACRRALAIAGPYTAVYPFDSPGGWHLIGRVVDAQLFGPDGALLRLGDHVRFVS